MDKFFVDYKHVEILGVDPPFSSQTQSQPYSHVLFVIVKELIDNG